MSGWGFGIEDFVKLYAEKLGIREDVLTKTLWGDFYLVPKTKLIYKNKPQGKAAVPMFVTFVLKPIWQVFQALLPERNEEQVQKIIKSLKLNVPPRDINANNTPTQVAHTILSHWLPLTERILDMVVAKLPNPIEVHFPQTEVRAED